MYKGQKIIAIIPARAGSKRCPGKNSRPLAGKPLVSWSIESALASEFLDKVMVTSDDPGVLKLASAYEEVITINRPAHLATDEATSLDVTLHALAEVKDVYNYGLLLQPTSPFRLPSDIDASIKICLDKKAKTCVGYTAPSKPSSLFNSATKEDTKQVEECKAPHRINGAIYLFEIKYLNNIKAFGDLDTVQYIMPEIRSIDIDTEEDFLLAEQLAGTINAR